MTGAVPKTRVKVAELFVGFGSVKVDPTEAETVAGPAAVATPPTATVADAPAGRLARLQVKVLFTRAQLPWELEATNDPSSGGRELVRRTFVAAAGPRLVTV